MISKIKKNFDFGQNFKKFDFDQNFPKISILIKFKKKKNDFGQNFQKFRKIPVSLKFSKNNWVKFTKKFRFCSNF